MKTQWQCDDGSAAVTIEATTGREAAEQYVAGGDYSDGDDVGVRTTWITDTWAQDRSDGEQGLGSTEYEPADDESRAWAAEAHA